MTSFVSDNLNPKLLIVEGAAPATPSAGNRALYVDSADHFLKLKDSGGLVAPVGGTELGFVSSTTASQATASTTLPPSATDITSITITLTLMSRPVLIRFYARMFSHTVASGRVVFGIVDTAGPTLVGDAVVMSSASAGVAGGNVLVEARVNPGAGSKTYKAQFASVDVGTSTVYATSTSPIVLQIVAL